MRTLALLRAVNLGQHGHPSAVQVLDAFRRAGADRVASVRGNGTIVFDAEAIDTPEEARTLARRAMAQLAAVTGRDHDVVTMPMSVLLPIVAEHAVAIDADRRELTLFDAEQFAPDLHALATAERRAQCTVLAHGEGWLVALNHHAGQSNGTPLVEHLLGVAATSRALSTLMMVAEREL